MKQMLTLFYGLLVCSGAFADSLFDYKIRHIMREYDAVGVSIALVKKNKIDYWQAFGYNPDYSDSLSRNPIKSTDISWIASISKTFIATAIMQLVEKGLLSLDDDVNKYLKFKISNPAYADIPITIKMLLCHRSSLNGEKQCNNFDELMPHKNKNYKSYYNTYVPGSEFNYCNTGYNLLAAIIEEVAGMRFDEYIDRYIMKPLQLYGGYDISKLDSNRFVKTYYYDKNSKRFIKQRWAYSYNKQQADNYILGYSTPRFWPSGGMKISTIDLAKFMLVHMNGGKIRKSIRIISEDHEQLMRKIQEGNRNYGLGLAHYNGVIPNETLIGMTGGSRGIHSAMFFHPKKKYGFIVICNGCKSNSSNGIEMNRKIVLEVYNSFVIK